MAWAAALGPCSDEPSRVPKGLGLAESLTLSRPPPWADSLYCLSSGGQRLGRLQAKGRGPPTVDTLMGLKLSDYRAILFWMDLLYNYLCF